MIKVDVRNCQRCQQDHEQLEFTELSNPVNSYRWWSMCPSTAEPVLLSMYYSVEQKHTQRPTIKLIAQETQ